MLQYLHKRMVLFPSYFSIMQDQQLVQMLDLNYLHPLYHLHHLVLQIHLHLLNHLNQFQLNLLHCLLDHYLYHYQHQHQKHLLLLYQTSCLLHSHLYNFHYLQLSFPILRILKHLQTLQVELHP